MSRRTWTAVRSALCTSAKMAALPDDTCRIFYAQLILVCDSYGCIDARPHKLLAVVWPLLGKTIEETARCVREIERAGLVVRHRNASEEWLEIPDWEEKQSELIRKRGKRTFGATTENDEPIADSGADVRNEVAEGQDKGGEGRDGPGVALTSIISNLPSSLAVSSSSPSRSTRAREPEPTLSGSTLAEIRLYPPLDVPAMHAAAARWEAYMREHGKTPWGASTWNANLSHWEKWGVERAVIAIDTAIRAGKFTPFEPKHDSAGASKAAKPSGQPKPEPNDEVRDRWMAKCARAKAPHPQLPGKTIDFVREYPGHEAAERELIERGLLTQSMETVQ